MRILKALIVLMVFVWATPVVAQVAPAKKPNFIVILLDDARLDDVCNVYPTEGYVPMPGVQRLLVAEGVTFKNAYACNGLCCPSRACILSGLCSHNNKIFDNEAPKGGIWGFVKFGIHQNNLGLWMQQGGYETFYGEKYANGYGPEWGAANGWAVWNAIPTPPYPSADFESVVLLPQALDFIATTPKDKPFFMFLGMTVPHNPNNPEEKYKGTLGSINFRDLPSYNEADISDKSSDVQFPLLTLEQAIEIDRDRQARRECLKTADDVVVALVNELAARGELDNTYIILTSDNGFFYGEHRYSVGKNSPYEEAIHMPLIVRGPGVAKGKEIPHLATLTDIAPTVLDLAGITNPRTPEGDPIDAFDGRSWKPVLGANPMTETEWRTTLFFEDAGFTGIRFRKNGADFVYITWGELYDMNKDPYQMDNLLARGVEPPEYQQILAEYERIRACKGKECW